MVVDHFHIIDVTVLVVEDDAVAGRDRDGVGTLAVAGQSTRRLPSPPDEPVPRSMNSQDSGVRSAARLGRFRSGFRWPTRILLALRAFERERVIASIVTLS